jgi:ParB/RepB/Spo0J family partition protein
MSKTIKRKLPRATTSRQGAAADPIDGDGARALLGSAVLLFPRPDQLTRHPDNREPTAAAVAAMVASMRAEGQIEPLLVRPMPGPQGERSGAAGWQIISGETRWRAARELGLESLAVRVVDATDPRALELMAICNARRVDLDPVEKARLIARLCAPIVRGGAGLTREAAAKIYGLESGAAASNLVRLLDLPVAWRERVASGAVPQSVARLLLPYVEAPRILEAIGASWEKAQAPNAADWDRENWSTRERAADEILDLVEGAKRRAKA